MASKFKIWVDQDNVNNVQDATTFDDDTQRKTGFLSGTPASSIRVNTALRQANLIACALMNIVQPDGDQDVNGANVKSSVSDIQSLLNTYLTQTLVANNSNYATKIGTSSTHPAIGSADRNVYVNNDGILTAGSYIPKLNGSSQSSSATSFYAPTGAGTNGQVLKSSGSGAPSWVDQSSLSVGSATNATNATYAMYTDADHTSKTIEERLTSLGFREGVGTFTYPVATGSYVKLYRQGNYVIGKVYISFAANADKLNFILNGRGDLFSVPSDFEPRYAVNFFIGVSVACDYMIGTTVRHQTICFSTRCEYIGAGDFVLRPGSTFSSSDIQAAGSSGSSTYNIEFQFGYEATPITT